MDEQTTTACVRHAYELLGDEVGFFMAGNRQLSARDIAAFDTKVESDTYKVTAAQIEKEGLARPGLHTADPPRGVAIGEKSAEYVARLVCMPHCLAPKAVQTTIGT